jgi:MFS family permease
MGYSAFDSILENKVGFGRYQYISYIFIGLTQFSDGAEIVALSVLLPVLKTEWNISEGQQGLLGSVLFFGIFLGSLLGGYVSDKYGRRQSLLYASLVQFFVGVISTMVSNINAFIFVRTLFGVIIGFTIPLTPSLASELTPVDLRGKGVVAINFFFSLGKFFAVIVAKICLESLNKGNWRAMLIWCSFPSLIVFVGCWFYVKESPRFLIAVGRVDEGVAVLNYMSSVNHPDSYEVVSQDEIDDLQVWYKSSFSQGETANVAALFTPKNQKITKLLWIMWFTLNFSFYGMIFILPFILSQLEGQNSSGTDGLNGLLYTIAGEVPSIVIALYIVEKEAFGRKGTIIYSNIGGAIIFFLAFISPVSLLIPMLTIGRLFLKLNFAMIYPLTTEFYPTTIRTAGMGFASGVGRIGSTIMPYLLLFFYQTSVLLPVFSFAICCVIHGYCAYLLPYDTRGKQLDLLEDFDRKLSGKKSSIAMVKL